MRNDPCPCGSGKKYKKCCLGRAARESLARKLASTDAMFHMAKAEGMTVEELQADFRDHALGKPKRGMAMAATFIAMYGGIKV